MDGLFRRFIGNKDVFCYPNGIHVSGDDVFVCDSNHSRLNIAHFTRNGVLKASYVCMQLRV